MVREDTGQVSQTERMPCQGRGAAMPGWRGPQPKARTRAWQGEPLTRQEQPTLPACPGDVGRRPLSSPRTCPAASGFVSVSACRFDARSHDVFADDPAGVDPAFCGRVGIARRRRFQGAHLVVARGH